MRAHARDGNKLWQGDGDFLLLHFLMEISRKRNCLGGTTLQHTSETNTKMKVTHRLNHRVLDLVR